MSRSNTSKPMRLLEMHTPPIAELLDQVLCLRNFCWKNS